MKNLKFYVIVKCCFTLLLVTTVFSCDSLVEDQDLINTTNLEDVEVVAEQNPAGSNVITLKTTPGVAGNWNYVIGKAFSDKVAFATPIGGTQTFTFSGNLGAEYFTKDIDITVDNFVPGSVDQDYFDLAGDDPIAGKTWVFAGGPGEFWWYMSPPNDPEMWQTAWWNAGGTCCPPSDAAGKMKFDFNGAPNYTYILGSSETIASFDLNINNQTLSFIGANVLGAQEPRGNPDGVYEIISLTEDELILYLSSNGGGTGWTWVFKPE